jgi:hypothetical protein
MGNRVIDTKYFGIEVSGPTSCTLSLNNFVRNVTKAGLYFVFGHDNGAANTTFELVGGAGSPHNAPVQWEPKYYTGSPWLAASAKELAANESLPACLRDLLDEVNPSPRVRNQLSLQPGMARLLVFKTDDDLISVADPRLLHLLKEISEWIISINVGSNDVYSPGPGGCKSFWCKNFPSYIFINGNMARVLLAAHTITGNQTYLDEGLRWCDSFVRVKHTITTSAASPLGMGSNQTGGAWWNTGYGMSVPLFLLNWLALAVC